MLWLPITLIAAVLQTARNAAQRGLTGRLSPLGATYTRFAFGLPFACIYAALVFVLTAASPVRPGGHYLMLITLAGASQVFGTAALIHLFQLRNFATGIAFSKTEILLTAAMGFALLGDHITPLAGLAIFIATGGLILLSKPGGDASWASMIKGLGGPPMLLGLATGAGYALAAVGFRAASLSLEPLNFLQSAAQTLAATLFIQTILMGLYLAWREPGQLTQVCREWRASLLPGVTGAAASAGWMTAMTLEAAAYVRMVGLLEVPLSIALTLFGFRERPSVREYTGTALLIFAIAVLLWDRLP